MRNLTLLACSTMLIFVGACADGGVMPLEPDEPLFAAGDCELGMTDAEAFAELDMLLGEVDALEAAGSLNSGQARALRNHVENARRQLERGLRCPAAAMLRALRQQVESFVGAGVLTEEEAAPLVDGVDRVLGDRPFVAATISTGGLHSCGLTWSGRVYCWGSNAFGQLGDGTTADRSEPTPVASALRFQSLATGRDFSCAVTTTGRAYCWGRNHRGQLGDGSTSDQWTPVAVLTPTAFQSIVAGTAHTCALDANDAAHCWGGGFAGQLGRGNNVIENPTPAPVLGGHRWRSVTLGTDYSCGLIESGQAYCWGSGTTGATGQGEAISRNEPSPVVTDLRFSHIAGRDFHTCALSDGAAYCWGGNFRGELGDGVTDRTYVPVTVATALTFASITTGAGTSCAVTAAGAALCWGRNELGQLGDGTTDDRPTPVPVVGGTVFLQLYGGGQHTCGLAVDGGAFCWGGNTFGQIGDGTTVDRLTPTAVAGWLDLD